MTLGKQWTSKCIQNLFGEILRGGKISWLWLQKIGSQHSLSGGVSYFLLSI